MSENNETKMEEIINDTEKLIDTLEILNNEIESYQIAKNNLIEVKEYLHNFINQSNELNNSVKDNFLQVNNILNSELTDRLDKIKSSNDELSEQSDITNNSIEKLNENFDNKFKILIGGIIINAVGLIALIIITLVK